MGHTAPLGPKVNSPVASPSHFLPTWVLSGSDSLKLEIGSISVPTPCVRKEVLLSLGLSFSVCEVGSPVTMNNHTGCPQAK